MAWKTCDSIAKSLNDLSEYEKNDVHLRWSSITFLYTLYSRLIQSIQNWVLNIECVGNLILKILVCSNAGAIQGVHGVQLGCPKKPKSIEINALFESIVWIYTTTPTDIKTNTSAKSTIRFSITANNFVAMYMHFIITNRSCINFSVRHDLSFDQLENLCILINKPRAKPFLIATWYRPPNSPAVKFSHFESLLGIYLMLKILSTI